MTQFIVSLVALATSIVSVVFHAVVVHRLRCTKELTDCMRDCMPSIVKGSVKNSFQLSSVPESFAKRVADVESQVSCLSADINELIRVLRGD